MSDYRLQENRIESFIKWYAWGLIYKDVDPAIWLMQYLNKRYEHNSEQTLWLCWLYANTYFFPTSWVLFNEFPDYELATVDRLTWWNTENYKRLRYQVDCKYNKGHLPVMFASYQKAIGNDLQRNLFESLYGQTEQQNFDNVWSYIIKNFHKFGRYTAWFYMQALKHTAGICLEPTSLMLSDYKGSKSHRNGLLYAIGWDDWLDVVLSPGQYRSLEACCSELMQEVKRRYPAIAYDVDAFTLETALCSFKKLFRDHNSRYCGYYLDRQGEEIDQVSRSGWDGIEWEVLWQARQETLDSRLLHNHIQKDLLPTAYNTGVIARLDWI